MRIFLTGAAGQVGTDLVPALVARGHDVVAFDVAKAPANPPAGATWVTGDLTLAGEMLDAVRASRPDAIVHLAAILSATGERVPHRAWRVNMEGTRNLFEAARLFGVKQVLFTSTIAAFGPGLPDPVPDDSPMRPTTMYGLTKVAGELLGEWYGRAHGIDFRGVRFPGLVSLVEPGGGTSDYVNWMYFDGVRKGAYEAFCKPDTRIPLMYMPDAIRALVELSEAPRGRLTRSVYNIAAMSPRADEIAAAVARRVPGVRLTFRSDPNRQAILDSWPRALDDSAARRDWGWRPRHDLASMSDELIAAVRAESRGAGAPPPPARAAGRKPEKAPVGKPAAKAGKPPAAPARRR